jgi:hypothetical protein
VEKQVKDELDRATMERLFTELANELDATGTSCRLITVGGSYLAFHGLRVSTRDVDTITALDDQMRSAIAAVAERNDLDSDWLNAQARPFAPAGLSEADCTVLFEYGPLTVLGPVPRWVFLMKLDAARPQVDVVDMVRLWPACGFASPADAVARYEAAYPMARHDPHLTEFVADIAMKANAQRTQATPEVSRRKPPPPAKGLGR